MSQNERPYSYIKGGVEYKMMDGVEVRILGNYNHPLFNENSVNYQKLLKLEGMLSKALWELQIQKQTYQEHGEEYAAEQGSGNLYTAELEIDKAVKLFQEIGD